ncbi:MAG TPA: class III extradiol ring-cleavage dioxygenase, partial [Spongiibacteraceae bacterium]|nr:class III extradiol ring-cleavage dioxygenase [Spongiibacteraceae bacterium]
GLDHGAWVPLREMFPAADVPVVQLSLQPQLDPAHHYRLGRALASLAADNILLIGSGSLIHNLHEAFAAMQRSAQPKLDYVQEFQQWIYAALCRGDIEALLSYRTRAPHAQRAHPTDEHLLPLFFALGAAGESFTVEREYDGIDLSALAMDVYRFSSST